MLKFKKDFLTRVGNHIFKACGADSEQAKMVAEHLTESNLMGLGSHGVIRIPWYVELIRQGTIKPNAKLTVINHKGATAILDCGFNFGQIGGLKATQMGIEQAQKYGVSCILAQNCNHIGRLGAYTTKAAEAGMVTLLTCNWTKRGHYVAPFGGCEARFATNPFSFAAPTTGDPIVLDMSTSAISEGYIRVCKNRNEKLPPDRIVDYKGMPSTDPLEFYGPPMGAILPFGGPQGYKGTGLAMMVEILSGTLAGNLITDETLHEGNNFCLILINISNFLKVDKFRQLADVMVKYIKSSRPAQDSNGVFIPGELDFNRRRRLLKEGIDIDENTWKQITGVASDLNVNVESLRELERLSDDGHCR